MKEGILDYIIGGIIVILFITLIIIQVFQYNAEMKTKDYYCFNNGWIGHKEDKMDGTFKCYKYEEDESGTGYNIIYSGLLEYEDIK